jgi:ATP-dependent Clp protease adaptor protein ClpS
MKNKNSIQLMSLPQWDEEIELLLDDVALDNWAIVLYNDDVNTFDWVIECLVKYCGHDTIQAEQCAWFVHSKGKYSVKVGSRTKLKPICEVLLEKGLSAKLEKNS